MNRRITFTAVACLIAGSGAASAQNADCQEFNRVFVLDHKSMSGDWVDSMGDGSAARASARNSAQIKTLLLMQLNLTLMMQHGCSLPGYPITELAYFGPAIKCATARLKQQPGDKKTPPDCDQDKWDRTVAAKK
jgi:hypothetical protein